MELFLDALLDALIDGVKMLPFLYLAYLLIEWLERHHGESIEGALAGGGRWGFIPGALLGCVPQCGFSAVASNLYASRVITPGTLLAVFIATSDEAIPLLAAEPSQWVTLVLLLACKVAFAIVGGWLLDIPLRRVLPHSLYGGYEGHADDVDCHEEHEESSSIFMAALRHTLGIISLLFEGFGEEPITAALSGMGIFQPMLTALVGLVPNCAVSVLLAQLYVQGAISFGSLFAGLTAGAGVGLAVLWRVNPSWKQNLFMTGLLWAVGASLCSAPSPAGEGFLASPVCILYNLYIQKGGLPMQYSIENDILRLTVDSHGAEPVSVIHKPTGAELLWQADPAVWKRHAPILFPYTGKLTGGKMLAKGVEYAGGQHGFARDVEHTMTHHADNLLEFELHANAETLPKWPYAFVLRSTFTLEGETVHHTLTVENPVEDKLCFGIGYHPAFALPFDDRHVTEDYEIRFDGVESPLCVSAQPNGLLNGQSYYLARNVEAIQLTDDLFDNDSHAMVNLRSAHVSVIEKDTGRSVICDVSDFPYTLIWSAPKKPLHFICIEPWHSLPGEENGPIDWEQRPCAAILKKGESWSTTLSTTFVR